jgi:S-adenosylmethionine synthetase
MVKLKIEAMSNKESHVEIVECKGFGHPDTLSDDLCEKASKALAKYYLKAFKRLFHYNLDKVLIVGGKSTVEFGGGIQEEPIKIYIAGRATSRVGNVRVPVKKIIEDSVKDHLRKFKELNSYEIFVEIGEGASNLKQVEKRIANDTSVGVAHYPFTKLEDMVLKVNDLLVSDRFRRKFLGVGQDVKVMGIRIGDKIKLLISIAFISKYVKSMDHYMKLKKDIVNELKNKFDCVIELNLMDNLSSVKKVYLTVTGLSCENGDDGQAGRGNRYNGLITPQEVMSIESYAGKNVYHPGKTYQVMSHNIAKDLVKKCGLERVNVLLLSRIGGKLNEPEMVYVQVKGKLDMEKIGDVVWKNFIQLEKFQKDLIFN